MSAASVQTCGGFCPTYFFWLNDLFHLDLRSRFPAFNSICSWFLQFECQRLIKTNLRKLQIVLVSFYVRIAMVSLESVFAQMQNLKFANMDFLKSYCRGNRRKNVAHGILIFYNKKGYRRLLIYKCILFLNFIFLSSFSKKLVNK